jgi:hypothetical protein
LLRGTQIANVSLFPAARTLPIHAVEFQIGLYEPILSAGIHVGLASVAVFEGF